MVYHFRLCQARQKLGCSIVTQRWIKSLRVVNQTKIFILLLFSIISCLVLNYLICVYRSFLAKPVGYNRWLESFGRILLSYGVERFKSFVYFSSLTCWFSIRVKLTRQLGFISWRRNIKITWQLLFAQIKFILFNIYLI